MSKQHLQINISFAAEHNFQGCFPKAMSQEGAWCMKDMKNLVSCYYQMERHLLVQMTITHNCKYKAKLQVVRLHSRKKKKSFFLQLTLKHTELSAPFPTIHSHSITSAVFEIASKLSLLLPCKVNILPCVLQQITPVKCDGTLIEKVQVCITRWKCILHCNVIFSDVMLTNSRQPDRYIC